MTMMSYASSLAVFSHGLGFHGELLSLIPTKPSADSRARGGGLGNG